MSQIEITNSGLSYELIAIEQFDKLLRVTCQSKDLEIYKDEIISTWRDQGSPWSTSRMKPTGSLM